MNLLGHNTAGGRGHPVVTQERGACVSAAPRSSLFFHPMGTDPIATRRAPLRRWFFWQTEKSYEPLKEAIRMRKLAARADTDIGRQLIRQQMRFLARESVAAARREQRRGCE